MPYVQRNGEGKVIGRYACMQPGIAEEWLELGHPDLDKSPEQLAAEAQQVADSTERQNAKAVASLLYLANHTNAEIRAFIDSNINVASVTDLASAKACLNRMENRIEDLAVGLAVFVRRELR